MRAIILLAVLGGCAADAGPPRWTRSPLLCAEAGIDYDALAGAAAAWRQHGPALRVSASEWPCDIRVVRGVPVRGLASTGRTLDADGGIYSATVTLHRGKAFGDAETDSDALDLQSVLTHELGHALGVEHSAEPGAVMYEDIARGEVRRELSQDDIDAAAALYR